MNQYDRDNLQFLLSADSETIKEWYSKTSHDDHAYAKHLLDTYQEELRVKLSLITDGEISDTTEATDYLRKFQLV